MADTPTGYAITNGVLADDIPAGIRPAGHTPGAPTDVDPLPAHPASGKQEWSAEPYPEVKERTS